jgi:DNA-binding NtrC family response regulator
LKVLIVEDDLATRRGLEESIKDFGFDPRSVGTSKEAAKVIDEFDPRILIVDIHLPDGDGIEVLRLAREKDPDREGVVITGQGSIDNAIEALRVGAFDYLLKPLRPAQLEVVFNRLADRRRLETEVETLRAELQETGRLGDLVGRSEPMTEIFEIIRRVARSNAPVLVTGASGSGKEVAARTIHRLSRRAGKPFVAFNCGAISPTSAVLSREPTSGVSVTSRKRWAGRSSWTRSPRWARSCRSSSCASWKTGRCDASAALRS